LREAGAEFYALSYDEPDALADFATEFGIAYPLLSDPESDVIRAFGILNTLVPEDDHPWFGMPFPGVYVTDAAGVITAKFFENHLALRPTVQQLARAVAGDIIDDELVVGDPPGEIDVDVQMGLEPLSPGVQRDLVVTFRLPTGQHIYGEPVPDGLVATAIEFDDGVIALEPSAPPTTLHVLEGTGEELNVYEGDAVGTVRIHQPVAISGGMARHPGDSGPVARISGAVTFQACDDEACGLPQRVPFEFDVPIGAMVTPHPAEEGDGAMDVRKHFARMSERRAT